MKSIFAHRMEKTMLKAALEFAHKADLHNMAIWNAGSLDPATPPLTPVQKLLRKHSIQKAVRAKVAEEVAKHEAENT